MEKREAVKAAFTLARRTKFVYVSTNGKGGYPAIRVMYNLLKVRSRAITRGPAALGKTFASWLGTNTSSVKVREARRSPHVCLYYSDNKTFEGLSVTGRLEEVKDDELRRAIYVKSWDVYYPGGMDGGDFTLFRFTPETGKYYHGLQVVEFDASGEAS